MTVDETEAVSDVNSLRLLWQLLNALAVELRGHNDAIVQLDLSEVEERIANENRICAELRCTIRNIQGTAAISNPRSRSGPMRAETTPESRDLWQDIEDVQAKLSRVLRTHVALVRRSSRSMHVIKRVLSNCYTPDSEAIVFGAENGTASGT